MRDFDVGGTANDLPIFGANNAKADPINRNLGGDWQNRTRCRGCYDFVSRMTVFTSVLLGLQGVVFAVWTFVMFRALFALWREIVEKTGKFNPSFGDTLACFHGFLIDIKWRKQRLLLLALTVLLFAIIWLSATGLQG